MGVVVEIVSRAWTGTYSTAQRDFALSMGPGPEPGERAWPSVLLIKTRCHVPPGSRLGGQNDKTEDGSFIIAVTYSCSDLTGASGNQPPYPPWAQSQ